MLAAAAAPVILGTGLTGLAISRTLSHAGIRHVLVGAQPADTPRLGESLNAEGSLEIARQFPDLTRFFYAKERLALFTDGHALAFDSIQLEGAPAFYRHFHYPPTVRLLHVDRIGFDRAVFDAAIADDHCQYVDDRPVDIDYRLRQDRITAVQLAQGEDVPATYVFDATNNTRFVARKVGVPYTGLDGPQRVVFAHYIATGDANLGPAWTTATALLRLDRQTDPIDGLAWCIPLGQYVSVGISVDPRMTRSNAGLLLSWVEQAYARRGIDILAAFSHRGAPVDLRYEHYTHERCHGTNWLLAGPTCCQIWFPSAAGVGTSLIAARLAPDLLRAPAQVAQLYQWYLDQVVASHARLAWLTEDDPWSMDTDEVRRQGQSMIDGNVKRLRSYLRLQRAPAELAFGDAPERWYERDRLLANPLRVHTASTGAQATRLFATTGEPDPWAGRQIEVALPPRPDGLDGPPAILRVVEMLSGKLDVQASAEIVTDDVRLVIDGVLLEGLEQWQAWVGFVRSAQRVTDLELIPTGLTASDAQWQLSGYWEGIRGGLRVVSPLLSMSFVIDNNRVAEMHTRRMDYTFLTGDSILPRVAFALLLGRILAKPAA
jgi:flavin-dependent dehydrogenase